MNCEFCKKNEATMHFKQAYNDQVKEVHLCQECAEENGFDVQSPMSLTDFLFGLEVQEEVGPGGPDKECPNCHIHRSDFQKTSRLGCAVCYETFSGDLTPLLADMQKGTQHVGKVPASERISVGIVSIQRDLDEAVASQNFEEAARLRDAIREIKGNPRGRRSKV